MYRLAWTVAFLAVPGQLCDIFIENSPELGSDSDYGLANNIARFVASSLVACAFMEAALVYVVRKHPNMTMFLPFIIMPDMGQLGYTIRFQVTYGMIHKYKVTMFTVVSFVIVVKICYLVYMTMRSRGNPMPLRSPVTYLAPPEISYPMTHIPSSPKLNTWVEAETEAEPVPLPHSISSSPPPTPRSPTPEPGSFKYHLRNTVSAWRDEGRLASEA